MSDSENSGLSPKTKLALAIASGIAVSKWARQNGVPRRTAFRWSKEPKVKAAAESCRRRALDRAVGRMSIYTTAAADGIIEMSKAADSESVRLSALRAVLADMMAASKFGGLEDRMTEIEEQLHVRAGHSRSAG